MGDSRGSIDVLVVDDDPDVRSFMEAAMLREGYITRTAVSAKEALAQAQQKKPDILLLDLLMPEMSGEELCTLIKKDAKLRKIIIFILSATADVKTKLRCFECGADEYLVKPVDPKEITARIERSLKLRRPKKIKPLPTKDDTHPLAESKRFGPYVVESLVGAGGMGQVYKALDPFLERPVAIKVLSRELCKSQEFVLRFRREARLLASINHANIATVYNYGEEENDLYFAMQWCPGGSIAELIANQRRIPLLDSVNYVIQCTEALAAASKKGIVHRDIKPGNLMFDENHRIKLVDFGLAYAEGTSTRLTDVSEFLGTPLYMSPEQAKKGSIDLRSDIYSLGIVFYQMIYAKTPFSGSTPMEIILHHATQPLPEFQEASIGVPYSAYRIIQKMTEKKPEDRYQQYEELAADLEALLNSLQDNNTEDLTEVSMRDLIQPPSLPSLSFQRKAPFEILIEMLKKDPTGVLHLQSDNKKATLHIAGRNIGLMDNATPVEIRQTIAEAFQWRFCEFAFEEDNASNYSEATVPLSEMLLEASRSFLDISVIRSSLRKNGRIRKTSNFEQSLSVFSLMPQESFVAYRIEGDDTTLDSLGNLTAFPEEQILRTVFLLDQIGAVEILEPDKPRKR